MSGGGLKQIVPIAASAIGAYYGGPLLAGATGMSAGAASAVAGAASGLAGSALAGGANPNIPNIEVPQLQQPTSAPTLADTQGAQNKTISAVMARRGRAASILTQGIGETLGG